MTTSSSTTHPVTLEFLGTGTSTGVPIVGCDCEVCISSDPRDQRLRSSVIFRTQGKTILVDTGPDLRMQLLRSNPERIDGILYTHMHSDHTVGLDDIRPFNFLQSERIPAAAPANAVPELHKRFDYAFGNDYPAFGVLPDLDMHSIEGTDQFTLAGVTIQPIPVLHGHLPILGYRIGDIAYLTDVKTLPDQSWELLEHLDVLVITALRRRFHPAHLDLEEALPVIERIGPNKAYLSHIGHELGRFADVEPTLPENVFLSYDGLVLPE